MDIYGWIKITIRMNLLCKKMNMVSNKIKIILMKIKIMKIVNQIHNQHNHLLNNQHHFLLINFHHYLQTIHLLILLKQLKNQI